MRKALAILSVIAALFLTACADSTQLGERAIIQAAAVDYDGSYRVSALLFSSGGSGGNTIDASQDNVIKVTGEGETLAEAIDNISLIDGKRIYMCETKLLILGGGFEEISAMEALNTLYYDMRCSLNMPVCCAEKAEFLTDLQFTEGVTSAEKPLSMIENAYRMGVSPKTTLLDLLAENQGGEPSLIPQFKLSENGRGMTSSDDGKTAVLCGSRQMQNGLLSENYNEAKTAGLMLVYGKSDRMTLNYVFQNSEKTCEAYGIKVRSEPIARGSSLVVTAKFRTRNGGELPEAERKTALKELSRIVGDSL